MGVLMRKKSPKTKTPKSKKSKEIQEDSAKKTPRKKASFAPEDSEGKKREVEEVEVNCQCIIGFSIRVDRGDNTKGGFDKKLSEGLTFLREFIVPAACILPEQNNLEN